MDEFTPRPRMAKFAVPRAVPTSSRETFGED